MLEKSDKNVIFFRNNFLTDENLKVTDFKSFDDFFGSVSYYLGWIGGLCVKTENFLKLKEPERFWSLQLHQIDVAARMAAERENSISLVEGYLMKVPDVRNKGGYNMCKVCGENFIIILKTLIKEGILSEKNYNIAIKDVLIKHICPSHFDYDHLYTLEKGGYFKYLFKYYKFKPYYYACYIEHLFKLFLRFIITFKKDEDYRNVKIFNFINIRTKRNKLKKRRELWRRKNAHNFTYLKEYNHSDKIEVGNGTYGEIDAKFAGDGNYKLIIGNYCSIANGVKFIVSMEHQYKCLSSYPFMVYYFGFENEAKSKGNIIIKDDVWICENALILSGVTVGQGAIIGAGAVVTKDVPPYAIVGGNPAKVIKYRFDDEIKEKLLKLDYSKLTNESIQHAGLKLYTELTKDNVDEIIEMITGVKDE